MDDSLLQVPQAVLSRRPSKQSVISTEAGLAGDALVRRSSRSKQSPFAEAVRRRSAVRIASKGETSDLFAHLADQVAPDEGQAVSDHQGYVIDLLSRNLDDSGQSEDYIPSYLQNDVDRHVNREILTSDFLEEVVFYHKDHTLHLDWKFDPKRCREKIAKIIRMKKASLTLAAELSNHIFKNKLLRANPEVFETQHERHARHQQFWAQLHEMPRKPPELPVTTAGVQEECLEDFHTPKSKSLSPTKTLDFKNRGEKDVWKARASKSRCAAGTWNWARGSADIPNQRGQTAGSRMTQTSGLWSFDEAPDFASDEPYKKSTADPNLASHPFFDQVPHFRWWKTRQPEPTTSSPFVTYNDFPKGKGLSPLPKLDSRPSTTQEPSSISRMLLLSSDIKSPPRRKPSSDPRTVPSLGSSASLPALASPPQTQSSPPSRGQAIRASSRGESLKTPSQANLMAERPYRSRASMREELSSRGSLVALTSQPELPSAMSLSDPFMSSAFPVPWQGKSPIPMLKCQESPTKKYLQAVQARGNIPRPIGLITGHSQRFAPGSMRDADLDAVVDMMQMEVKLEEIVLDGNTKLSENALTGFMEAISKAPAVVALKHLSLKGCLNAGLQTCDVVIKMLLNASPSAPGIPATGCANLRFLDVSGIPIGTRNLAPLAKAVGGHSGLQTLFIADVGLGGGTQPVQYVSDILGNPSIQKLDMGWNCFTEGVFSAMGARIAEMQSLKSLQIANVASAAAVGYASPILHLIEHLSRATSLKVLDMSLNRIDFRGALAIEDALQYRKDLTDLDLSSNPLGFMGMRSILRLLVHSSSGLTHFICNDCSAGKATDSHEVYQVFSATNPSGRYVLELHRPYHRGLLRMLYKTAEHFNLPPDQAFSDIKSNPAYSHASKDSHGTWVVPTRGDLAVTFSIDKAVTEAMKDIEDFDFNHVIERHEEITRVRPAPTKVVPLLAAWKRIEGRSNEQMVFLNALSQDFLLSYEHIYQMVTSRTMLVDIIEKLLPCLPEGPVSRYLSLRLVPSLGELLQLQQRQRHFLSFNVDNPNGRYKLDLESASDHAVAERMVLLDRWEAGVARKLKRVDTSQLGNFSQIRNVCFQHQRRKQGIQEWRMPETGILEYDYSTGQRPPSTAKQLDDQTYSNILVGLHSSECGTQDQLLSLQAISHQVYITAMQMRGFLGIYKEKSARWSLFVLWFPRIMDWHNEKVFRVAFEDDSELCELRDRLGWVTLFPFIQPEQAVFNLDFAFFEQRTVASLVMYLSKQESIGNIRDVKYIREDGFVDPLTAGIPQSWDDASKLPTGGTLHVSYVCAPEDRAFQVRKTLCEKYCYRKLDVSEDDVMWWAALTEAPRDVLTYLQWILSKFSTPKVCFKEIDGPGGNGVISLREFEEGWKEMNCQIFKGADEKKRINDIFRWLDPSGEGQVSEGEFSIMDALAKEIKQSVTEFVQFAMRTFGPDLKDTWHFMDDDGGGEIDLQEWCNACQELGYFGPTEPIFRYLDADNEGTVSLDEFMKLDDFKTQEPKKCKERLSTITPADRLERFRQTSANADETSSSSVTSSRATSQSGSRPGSSHRKSLKHKT